MGNRLTRIYTRTGDDGTTGMAGGERIGKDSARIEAIGAVDELNSCIGALRAEPLAAATDAILADIQHMLFDVGAELAMPGESLVGEHLIGVIEGHIDAVNAGLPPLKEFVLPGGNRAAALAHVARAVCRRAERRMVSMHRASGAAVTPATRLVNRLSDLLFVTARALARADGGAEVLWEHNRLPRN